MSIIGKMYIDGEWVKSSEEKTRNIINPADGSIIATVTEGTPNDVKHAAVAAKRAFYEDGWMDTPPVERARLMFKLADELEKNADEFSRTDTINGGKPLRESVYDVSDAVACFRYFAGLATKPHGQTYNVADDMQPIVVREPIGVCGQIIPWNYPLLMAVWKLAPALAAGNTVVFKPAEWTPLSAIKLFELIEKVGYPKGVVNLVLGAGETVGNEIAENMDIDKIAFTGGTDTGRLIMRAAACNIKNLSLELGGKSPNIVFADADFETAVDYAMYGIFPNQGQICSAGSRLLLDAKIYDRFLERLVERTKQITIGNGIDEGVEMGPLISQSHMKRVLSYIDLAKKEGARLLCGGYRITENGLDKGYFVAPTIFADTTPDMTIVREEVFGPVLAVQKFETDAEAIKLANDTPYGLAGGVFSTDGARALRVIRKLRAGITWINAYNPTYNEAPWGGYKQSGIGRELGTFGFEEYTEVKQININLNPCPTGWYKN
jgi:betaine-aldehyde dehydrogenase